MVYNTYKWIKKSLKYSPDTHGLFRPNGRSNVIQVTVIVRYILILKYFLLRSIEQYFYKE